MRFFKGGACRDSDTHKLDYEGFLSPVVLEAYAKYMHRHRIMADGGLRASDNWQSGQGIPKGSYAKSLTRHFMDFWLFHRGAKGRDDIEDALCGILFNAQGYLFELLRDEDERTKK